MSELDLSFLPTGGFSSTWLKTVYSTHIARSRAVGKDGIRAPAFFARLDAECDLIAKKVNDGTYQFTNYREKLIARGAKRCPRQISIPTIRDRLALRGALEFLKTHFPAIQPQPPHLYIKQIKAHLDVTRDHSSFLRMDICDFYPSLHHNLLDSALRNSDVPEAITTLIMKAVATSTGSSSQPTPTVGVPQGLSISNALAALYMASFDNLVDNGVFYRRYVDDILVIDNSESINSTYKKLWSGLKDIGLTSHPMGTRGKTETHILKDGVQYLGYEISPKQISIRPSSISKMFSNISKVLTCFKYKNDKEKHIFRLNLKITGCIINNTRRGWIMFFSQTENISQLSHIDSWLIAEISNFNIPCSKIKTLKKSYYEIRYNIENSSYIPNFDKYSIDQKK